MEYNLNKSSGFTLIEVLVAMSVLSVVMAVLVSNLLANASLNRNVELKNDAVRLSEKYMEDYRRQGGYGALRTSSSSSVVVNNYTLTVNSTFCPSDMPSDLQCDSNSVYIRLEVKYGSKLLQKTETFFTSL
ncbi:type II secretion system protein [Deinococcus hopiensis]|uniref:type II secretion system protein n=1 Tax=Deinococcus hopiensis TaxID=309885 RepID=UPI000A0114CD